MGAMVHVVARYLARPGKEDEVRQILSALVAPSRRETNCYQYDLLVNPSNPRDFCFVERWGHDQALDEHAATSHVQAALVQVADLVEVPPDVRRYRML
jgi:quinol monooxygenase YgiN